MSGLAHYFESDGLATALIALIRPHAERMKPPRALAVPFELGRPFGAPNEPEFQERVLRAVLALLTRPGPGPVLEDFPDTAPESEIDMEGWACPINLAPPVVDLDETARLTAAWRDEIGRLQPWYDRSVEASGRTMFGVSGEAPEEIAAFLASFLADPATERRRADLAAGDYVKLLVDDLRNFYIQAVNAQPGKASDRQINDWIWSLTIYAKAITALNDLCDASDDPTLKRLGNMMMIPLAQRHWVRRAAE